MTLQGPHQVAKQSSTISVSFCPIALSKSALLVEVLAVASGLVVGADRDGYMRRAADLRHEVVHALLGHGGGEVADAGVCWCGGGGVKEVGAGCCADSWDPGSGRGEQSASDQ